MILYTIDCPKCKVLEKKLNQKNIIYDICKDTEIMSKKQIIKLPMLEVDDRLLSFKEAVNYINNME